MSLLGDGEVAQSSEELYGDHSAGGNSLRRGWPGKGQLRKNNIDTRNLFILRKKTKEN